MKDSIAFGAVVSRTDRNSCIFENGVTRSAGISTGFDKQERKRFHNLLKLAAESPFEGEREAALAAAKRLARKHGMSLQDAAAEPEQEDQPSQSPKRNQDEFWGRATARTWSGEGFEPPPGFEERWGKTRERDERWKNPDDEKRNWNAAYDAARKRGLDQEAEAAAEAPKRRAPQQPKSSRRMNPEQHARALLQETTLPLEEIAAITKLTIYQIVAIKLKLRAEADRRRRARA